MNRYTHKWAENWNLYVYKFVWLRIKWQLLNLFFFLFVHHKCVYNNKCNLNYMGILINLSCTFTNTISTVDILFSAIQIFPTQNKKKMSHIILKIVKFIVWIKITHNESYVLFPEHWKYSKFCLYVPLCMRVFCSLTVWIMIISSIILKHVFWENITHT